MVSELKIVYMRIFCLFCVGENQICKIIHQRRNMSFYELQTEYPFDDSSNHIAWKDKMEAVMEDNGLKEFVDNEIPKLPTSNAKDLAECRKSVEKVRRIILEGFWDHIVSSLDGKDTPYSMWKALTDLFQNSSDHMKLELKEKLRNIKIEKGDSILKYLTKFTHFLGWSWKFQDHFLHGRYGEPSSSRTSQKLAKLSKLYQWEGEATRLGTTVVGCGIGRDLEEYQIWILIKDIWWGQFRLSR